MLEYIHCLRLLSGVMAMGMDQFLRTLLEIQKTPGNLKRTDVLEHVVHALVDNLSSEMGVETNEIAILYRDKRQHLRFLAPDFLEKSGSIPVTHTSAFVCRVVQSGKPIVENHFSMSQHLGLFEAFGRLQPGFSPIQKMMGIPLLNEQGEAFGAIEISRKGDTPEAAGPDWTEPDLARASTIAATIQEHLFNFFISIDLS